MNNFWKKSLYINIFFGLLYFAMTYWDIYVKKGGAAIVGNMIFWSPLIYCIFLIVQIIVFIIRIFKKENNKYAFTSIIMTLFLILIQYAVLFIITGSGGDM